jgi:hypothetical protein
MLRQQAEWRIVTLVHFVNTAAGARLERDPKSSADALNVGMAVESVARAVNARKPVFIVCRVIFFFG